MNISADYLLRGTPTDVDRGYLVDLMKPLDGVELSCLEEIIKAYLVACEHQEVKG